MFDVEKSYIDILNKVCSEKLIDPYLMRAIVLVESGGVKWRTRYEPKFQWFYQVHIISNKLGISDETCRIHQATSWGLGQIMGAVAYELGFTGYCPELCDPLTNLNWCGQLINKLEKRHTEMSAVVASYNAGSPRKEAGRYVNQTYVDKVYKMITDLKRKDGAN